MIHNNVCLCFISKLGINDGESGTRLALKYFATETCTEFDQHMLGDADEFNVPEDELCNPQSNITKMGLFKSYKEVINITKMDAESIKKIHSTTSKFYLYRYICTHLIT